MVPCCNSSLLIMPVLGSLACEWLWCLATILACWSCLSLALQAVSGCGALLQFQPANHACPWLSRLWVTVVPCYNSSLLIMPVLGSPVGEWLWCLATILACWSCLSLVFQDVSGHDALLQFYLADHACPWLSRKWVAVVPCCNSGLLIMLALGSSVCEWLWCSAATVACWLCLSLALQLVSDCCALLQL